MKKSGSSPSHVSAFGRSILVMRVGFSAMRIELLIVGVLVLGFGILLVTTNGVVAGVNLPGVIGYPSCSGKTSSNTTSPQCYGLAGFGVGTIVCLFGLGLVANGLRSPGTPKGFAKGSSGMPPEMAATLAQAQQSMAAMTARGVAPGSRYCAECGRPNAADAKFCQGCGRTMPPPQGSPPPSTGGTGNAPGA